VRNGPRRPERSVGEKLVQPKNKKMKAGRYGGKCAGREQEKKARGGKIAEGGGKKKEKDQGKKEAKRTNGVEEKRDPDAGVRGFEGPGEPHGGKAWGTTLEARSGRPRMKKKAKGKGDRRRAMQQL